MAILTIYLRQSGCIGELVAITTGRLRRGLVDETRTMRQGFITGESISLLCFFGLDASVQLEGGGVCGESECKLSELVNVNVNV